MLLSELAELLTEMAEQSPPSTEVRLATQRSWPFEYSIEKVAEELVEDEEQQTPVVYLAEGEQLRYLPGEAKRAVGWGE